MGLHVRPGVQPPRPRGQRVLYVVAALLACALVAAQPAPPRAGRKLGRLAPRSHARATAAIGARGDMTPAPPVARKAVSQPSQPVGHGPTPTSATSQQRAPDGRDVPELPVVYRDALPAPHLAALLESIGAITSEPEWSGLRWLPLTPEGGEMPEEPLAIESIIRYLRDTMIEPLRPPGSPPLIGAEWWVQHRRCSSGMHFHMDRDESLQLDHGRWSHPVLASIFYVTNVGGPTLMLKQRMVPAANGSSHGARFVPSMPRVGVLAYPNTNDYAVFNGTWVHGVVPRCGAEDGGVGDNAMRTTFLVNYWDRRLTTKPLRPAKRLLRVLQGVEDPARAAVPSSAASTRHTPAGVGARVPANTMPNRRPFVHLDVATATTPMNATEIIVQTGAKVAPYTLPVPLQPPPRTTATSDRGLVREPYRLLWRSEMRHRGQQAARRRKRRPPKQLVDT